MRYFTDASLINEVKELKLGIVMAGETKVYEFWVKNDTKANLRNVQFSCNHHEVKVMKAPTALEPDGVGQLVLEWSPSVVIKDGLDTQILHECEALYGRL